MGDKREIKRRKSLLPEQENPDHQDIFQIPQIKASSLVNTILI